MERNRTSEKSDVQWAATEVQLSFTCLGMCCVRSFRMEELISYQNLMLANFLISKSLIKGNFKGCPCSRHVRQVAFPFGKEHSWQAEEMLNVAFPPLPRSGIFGHHLFRCLSTKHSCMVNIFWSSTGYASRYRNRHQLAYSDGKTEDCSRSRQSF